MFLVVYTRVNNVIFLGTWATYYAFKNIAISLWDKFVIQGILYNGRTAWLSKYQLRGSL